MGVVNSMEWITIQLSHQLNHMCPLRSIVNTASVQSSTLSSHLQLIVKLDLLSSEAGRRNGCLKKSSATKHTSHVHYNITSWRPNTTANSQQPAEVMETGTERQKWLPMVALTRMESVEIARYLPHGVAVNQAVDFTAWSWWISLSTC